MSSSLTVIYKNKAIKHDIVLPLSKSLSNRLMMIYALNNWDDSDIVYSDADDSVLLKYLLTVVDNNRYDDYEEEPLQLNCKNAGTVFRFLTPYLCDIKRSFVLTGSDRMKERPIEPLVAALQSLGADIRYCDKDNFPPLCINPSELINTEILLDISKSSQFASALLLMLPKWFKNSKISFSGEISSWPYIEMTLKLMNYYGVKYSFDDNEIFLSGGYQKPKKDFTIEADWSSAAYWYQTLALAKNGEIFMPNLNINGLQGDIALVDIYKDLGVATYQKNDGVLIKSEGQIVYNQTINFKNFPDIAPSVINTCAALGVMGKFTGLESLNLKESRRNDVLCRELNKLGFDLRDNGFGEYVLINSCKPEAKSYDFSGIEIQTADDHRMAMAFATMAIIGKSIQISNSNSVFKSYPFFWDEMRKIFGIV